MLESTPLSCRPALPRDSAVRRWWPIGREGRGAGRTAALINGAVGVVVAPRGRLMMLLNFTMGKGESLRSMRSPTPIVCAGRR